MRGDHRIFIQARMSSSRFPGKMMATFRGRPLIAQVLGRFEDAGLRSRIVVLTSDEPSDDRLAGFISGDCGVPVFRGELDDVVARFRSALAEYPCEWFVRISGDSPLIDPSLVEKMIGFCEGDFDVVSNVARRTFPAGQSVECVRSEALLAVDPAKLTPDQREHVTKFFYDDPSWRMRRVVCSDLRWAGVRMVVDYPEDLVTLQAGVEFPSFGDLARLEN
jgi:spore coat polysaccharide biosynthesis protein SpsF